MRKSGKEEKERKTQAKIRRRAENPVGGQGGPDGAESHDRGRSSQIYPEMQYGQREFPDGDRADGDQHDKNIRDVPCVGGVFLI